VFFDDRLATVLRQRATGEAGLRTQFRQLLDLLGKDRMRRGHRPDHSLLAAAWLRMDALAEAIPAAERARMVREPGWRFHSPDLASHLAEHEPEVASAALGRAELSSDDWTALIPRLPVRARGFLRNRRDLPVDAEALLARLGVHDRGLPAPAPAFSTGTERSDAPIPLRPPAAAPAAPTAARDRDDNGRTEISALVERIAQFRRQRGEQEADFERSPRLPLGELPERIEARATNFGFAADVSGRIVWASVEVAPMVIGTRLFAAQRLDDSVGAESGLERAFARRQPIARGEVKLAGASAVAGDWLIDAQPRFSEDGHFTGYFGRLRRAADDRSKVPSTEAREADRIRQLLHELRTPVTAVQGYAEVIQQQLFGPAPHEYRALAAAIAADAARILAGFEELDRLARLETGAMRVEPGESDLAALMQRTTEQLAPVLAQRGAEMRFDTAADATVLIAVDPEDAEALAWRVLASIAAVCGPDEHVALSLSEAAGAKRPMARLSLTLPVALAAEDNLFATTVRASASAVSPGLFGTGFALRLARAEARGAGGDLLRDGAALTLTLPLLTGASDLPSHNDETRSVAGV
jgi:two-component system, OmpR family, sensor kinase